MMNYYQSNPLQQTSVTFSPRHTFTRKCIWQCRLQNAGSCLQASVLKSFTTWGPRHIWWLDMTHLLPVRYQKTYIRGLISVTLHIVTELITLSVIYRLKVTKISDATGVPSSETKSIPQILLTVLIHYLLFIFYNFSSGKRPHMQETMVSKKSIGWNMITHFCLSMQCLTARWIIWYHRFIHNVSPLSSANVKKQT